MKKVFFIAIALTIVLVACNSNNEKAKESTETKSTDTTTITKEEAQPVAQQLYSCSMHPEVIGKKDESCSKCGMKLTVPVKK